MYCVKCGVRLQDGVKECPLCRTPVRIEPEDGGEPPATYSARYPDEPDHARLFFLSFVTAVLLIASLVCLVVCLRTYGALAWSGFVIFGAALVWVLFILPNWFSRWRPLVFVPIDFAAACGFLLYVCLYTGGRWFLSFAFPVTALCGLLAVAALILFRRVRGGRVFIIGGLLVAVGASLMLVEFFQHITFGAPMFLWSLYCVSGFTVAGLFLIIAGIIRPLREYLRRKFFL